MGTKQGSLIRTSHSPIRCPYCHDDVEREKEQWVACEGCLARHHAGCWSEGGCCGSCGEEAFVAPRGSEAERRPASSRGVVTDQVIRPSLGIDLRGRRVHFEGSRSELSFVGTPDSEFEEFELRLNNETSLPQSIELRQLPGWIVSEGSIFELPAQGSLRILLSCQLSQAPKEPAQRRRRGAGELAIGKCYRGEFLLSCEDDAFPIKLELRHPMSSRSRLGFGVVFGLMAHVGLVFAIVLSLSGREPTRLGGESDLDWLNRERLAAAQRGLAKNLWVCLGTVIGVVLLLVLMLSNF